MRIFNSPESKFQMNWTVRRSEELADRIRRFAALSSIRYTFLPSTRVQEAYRNGYFPDMEVLNAELASVAPAPFCYVPYDKDANANIVIASVHGAKSEAEALWDLRRQYGEEVLIVAWLWDNHVSHIENMRAALAADIVFVSHAYAADYVHTPASLAAGHVPACSAQWTRAQASDFFEQAMARERRHKLLVNYVIQEPASPLRRRVLEDYRTGLAEADVFLMSKEERARYFDLSRRDRFFDWADYKATVIVPMGRDLSTRVFDALLAGQVLIVPEFVDDFDAVIPRNVQEALGIVRVQSLELPDIREAAKDALGIFDAMGIEGARARHAYALDSHMLVNRVEQMLYVLWLISEGELIIDSACAHYGDALYLRKATSVPG